MKTKGLESHLKKPKKKVRIKINLDRMRVVGGGIREGRHHRSNPIQYTKYHKNQIMVLEEPSTPQPFGSNNVAS